MSANQLFQLTSCAFGVLCALAATNVHAPEIAVILTLGHV
jgi:hypothetical protein